jgi:hypothetical protein
MHDYPEILTLVDAQIDELEKIAAVGGALSRFYRGAGAMTGRLVGAGGGAAAGAGLGYATGQTPEERKSRALSGAVLGGVAGLLPGQFLTAKGTGQAKQFGQRQLYGATGFIPHKGKLTQIGRLTPDQREAAHKAVGWSGLDPSDAKPGWVAQQAGKLGKKGKKVERFLAAQKAKALAARREQVRLGETSIPGLAKGYLKTPIQTAGRALRGPGLALGVAAPAAFSAPGVVESVRERDPRIAARTLAETAGYSLSGGLPMAAALGVGSGVSALSGGLLGQGANGTVRGGAR